MRAKFWLSPTIDAVCHSCLDGRPILVCRSGHGERLDALIFAIAAVGVGVEIADGRPLDSSSDGGRTGHCVGRTCGGQPFGEVLREGHHDLPNPAWFGETHGGSGGVAHLVNCGLGEFAEAYDKEPFGCKPRGGVQENRLIRSGFEFTGGKNAGCSCLNRRIGGHQGRPGPGIGIVGGLEVCGQDDEQFSLDSSG